MSWQTLRWPRPALALMAGKQWQASISRRLCDCAFIVWIFSGRIWIKGAKEDPFVTARSLLWNVPVISAAEVFLQPDVKTNKEITASHFPELQL